MFECLKLLFQKENTSTPTPVNINMSEEEYLNQRLENQIRWYSSKSQTAQKKYKCLKKLEISIFLLFTVCGTHAATVISIPYTNFEFTIGCLITIISAFLSYLQFKQSLEKYHENWILYRQTCELLKHEKYLYLTHSGGYLTACNPFNDLVERCESIISSENIDWAQLHATTPSCPTNQSTTNS
mgnify:CR=1 FL=1